METYWKLIQDSKEFIEQIKEGNFYCNYEYY